MSELPYTVPRRDSTFFVILRTTFSAFWNHLATPSLRLLGRLLYPIFRDRQQHAHATARPHGFTSNAFVADGVVRPIPAPHFQQPFQSWRLVSLLQFYMTCLWYVSVICLLSNHSLHILELELGIRITSFCLRKAGIIHQPLSLMIIYKRHKDYNVGFPSCLKLLSSIPVPNR